MKKFIRRPLQIEAIEITYLWFDSQEADFWTKSIADDDRIRISSQQHNVQIETPFGTKFGFAGDWIIKYPNNDLELYSDKEFHNEFMSAD